MDETATLRGSHGQIRWRMIFVSQAHKPEVDIRLKIKGVVAIGNSCFASNKYPLNIEKKKDVGR